MVDAEKLALYEVRGTAGPFAINFLSIEEGPAAAATGRASPLRRCGRPSPTRR